MMAPQILAATRVLTAIFGGYALAAYASATLAMLLATCMPRADAALTGMLASFALYAIAVVWTFGANSLRRAWSFLLCASALLYAIRLAL